MIGPEAETGVSSEYTEQLVAISSLVALAKLIRYSPMIQAEDLEFSDDSLSIGEGDHVMDMNETAPGDKAFGLVIPKAEFEFLYLDQSLRADEVADSIWFQSAESGLYVRLRRPALMSRQMRDHIYFGSVDLDNLLLALVSGDPENDISGTRPETFDIHNSVRLQPYLSYACYNSAT